MKWYEIECNRLLLYRYLVRVLDYSGEALLRAYEKPQDYGLEYNEALRWHERQEAMFKRVSVS